MENIVIEFEIEELKEIIMDYYGIKKEDFDISDYNDEQIKWVLLN